MAECFFIWIDRNGRTCDFWSCCKKIL